MSVTVPYTFANRTSTIPLSQLDADFTTLATAINGILVPGGQFINLQNYAVYPDDPTKDSTAGILAWFADVLSSGHTGYAPAGTYYCFGKVLFDYTSKASYGFTIIGDGNQRTIFSSTYSTANDAAFELSCTGGSGVYASISGIGFAATHDGPTFRIGRHDYADFQDLVRFNSTITNTNNGGYVALLEMNACFTCFINLNGVYGHNTGTYPSDGSGPTGNGLVLRQTSYSTISASIGGVASYTVGGPTIGTGRGVWITGLTNYGNVFINTDLEYNDYSIYIDSNSYSNSFIGGIIGGKNAAYIVFATAGENNVFQNIAINDPTIGTGTKLVGAGIYGIGVNFLSPNEMHVYSQTTGTTINIAAQATGTNGYLPPSVCKVIPSPAGTLAALTINFPTNVPDNYSIKICDDYAITALSLTASGSDSIFGWTNPTSVAAGQSIEYQYSAANATWFRI